METYTGGDQQHAPMTPMGCSKPGGVITNDAVTNPLLAPMHGVNGAACVNVSVYAAAPVKYWGRVTAWHR